MTNLQKLTYVAGLNQRVIFLYEIEGEEVIRPYHEENVQIKFKGKPEEFLNYSSNSTDDCYQALIDQAYEWAIKKYNTRETDDTPIEEELEKFYQSAILGANIPGYSITPNSLDTIRDLIKKLRRRDRREYWYNKFTIFGI